MSKLFAHLKKYFSSEDMPAGQILRIVLPLFLEQLFFALVALCNGWVIAVEGEAAVAAVSMTSMSNYIFTQLGLALAVGGTVIIAQYAGAGNQKGAGETLQQTLLGAGGFALALAAVLLAFLRPVVSFLLAGAPEEVLGHAQTYFRGMCLSLPLFCFYQGYAGCLRGWGQTRTAMRLTITVTALELSASLLLVRVFRQSVDGMAAAMVLSRLVGAMLAAVGLRQICRELNLSPKGFFRPNAALLGRIARIALPVALENTLFSFGKTLSQRFVAGYGSVHLAGVAVYNSVSGIYNALPNAAAASMLPIVGMCLGRGQVDQARSYAHKFTKAAKWVILLLDLLFIPLTIGVAHIYGVSAESRMVAYQAMGVIFIGQPLLWARSFLVANSLRAGGDAAYTSVVSMATMWGIRVLLSYLFTQVLRWGLPGVTLAMVIEWSVRGIFFGRRLKGDRWYRHKVML